MLENAIYIEQASLSFQNEYLFQNLSVTFPAGTFNCLLGVSGVGKTSLLQLIAKSHSGKVAYLTQEDSLLPWLSALNNALIGPRLRNENNIKEYEAKALQLFKDVGLADDINKYPYQLSGGMRQRVALVRTLIEDRKIVLMDEPFAKLDAITRMELQTLATNLLHNRTVVMVTHDPLEALRIGENVYVMSGNPATVEKIVELKQKTPRDLADPALISLQKKLLERLI